MADESISTLAEQLRVNAEQPRVNAEQLTHLRFRATHHQYIPQRTILALIDEVDRPRKDAGRLDALEAVAEAARLNRSARATWTQQRRAIDVARLKMSQEQIDAALDALDTQEDPT